MKNSRTLGTPPNSPHPKKENGSFLITLVSPLDPSRHPTTPPSRSPAVRARRCRAREAAAAEDVATPGAVKATTGTGRAVEIQVLLRVGRSSSEPTDPLGARPFHGKNDAKLGDDEKRTDALD